MKYLSIIFLILVIFSCKKEKSFIVKGKVLDKDSGIVRFSQLGKNYFDAEIFKLTNEKFYFKGEIDCPEQFFIQYKLENTQTRNEPERYYFYVEPGSLTEIELNPENVSKSKFKGSKTGREYLKFQQTIYDKFDSKKNKLRDDFKIAQKTNDKELMDAIIEKHDSVINKEQNWKLKYIWSHPKSYLSAQLLHEKQFTLDIDTFQLYFDKLDKKLNKSKHYQKMESFFTVQIGKPFVDFELPDSSGTLHRFSSISKNKVTLIDFWFRGCKACREHNRELKKLYEQYESKGFEIVGVSGDKDRSDFIETINEDKMTWLNLHDKDYKKSVGSIYELNTYPYNVLIDKNGHIAYKANDYLNLKIAVDSLMSMK